MLLIAAGLTGPQLALLYREALVLGLEALIEVHTRAELERVRRLDRAILGVNSRNLSTLKTDLAIARSLAPCLPAGRPAVAESGLRTAADIRGLQALGYRGFLIGGTLMKAAAHGDFASGRRRGLANMASRAAELGGRLRIRRSTLGGVRIAVEVPADERDTIGDLVVDLMRGAAELDVPLEVNVAWGDTWAAAKG